MIKASEITYIDFLHLQESAKATLEEAFIHADSTAFESTIKCIEWRWEDVKNAQELLSGELTYQDIFDIVKIASKKVAEYTQAAVVFKMFKTIRKQIEIISTGEANALSGELSVKEKVAIEEVGGFEEFGYFPQTLQLCKLLNTSYNEVLNTQYSVCFMALYYETKSKRFEKIILTRD